MQDAPVDARQRPAQHDRGMASCYPLFYLIGGYGGDMGNFRSYCVSLVLAVVFLIPAFSFAETIPATQSYTWKAATAYAPSCRTSPYCSFDFAAENECKSQQFSPGSSWNYVSHTVSPPSPTQLAAYPECSYVAKNGSGATTTWTGLLQRQTVSYSCPSGYTLEGTQCTRPDCPAGTVWNEISQTCRCENGSDVGDDGTCCPQPGEALAQMQKCEVYSTAATSCNSSNSNGCAIRCNKVQFQIPPNITGGDGVQITDGIPALGEMCKYTGSKANAIDRLGSPLADDEHGQEDDMTKPKPPPKTPEGCMAAGMGYVQSSTGATTCVKAGTAGEMKNNSSGSGSESGTGPDGQPKPGSNTESNKSESKGPGGQTSSKETVTTTNSDGTSTVTTTETKCVNGNCEKTVTIEKKDAQGNTIDKDESKESGDKDDFCIKNPNDLACKKPESKFSGECDTGFACEGDAVTCAIAQASWKNNCLFSEKDTSGLIPSVDPAGTPSQLLDAEKALNKDGSADINIADSFQSYNQNWINYSSACPVGNQTFQIGPQTLEIPAEFVCDIGRFVRLLVHVMAYLTLLRIFARGLV